MAKTALIIGAGPAGLTAAYELLDKTDIKPVILEQTDFVGGISATRCHNGNRMDMGGHRFFSKSKIVTDWWEKFLPLQGKPSFDDVLFNRQTTFSEKNNAPDPKNEDLVMLYRPRVSRIYYAGAFFDYPVKLNFKTMRNLGVWRMLKIACSYMLSVVCKRKENSLEDFFINRFGQELYKTFFKDYTEKLWGKPCNEISADWGAQRVKGLSVMKVLLNWLKIGKKETSLIDNFRYPKFGPGQLWEEVARQVEKKGGKIYLNTMVLKINTDSQNNVLSVTTREGKIFACDYLLSSMPVQELVAGLENVPEKIKKIAQGLVYRNFRTSGFLLKKMKLGNMLHESILNGMTKDTWIYIQEKGVKLGRVQIFNNWSPYLVEKFEETVWIGLEYFCDEDDQIWQMQDDEFIAFSASEAAKINLIEPADVLDAVSFKVPKAYPAYFGPYGDFPQIRAYLDTMPNLFVMGRNGMHRYNNMDHSMLSAMAVVKEICHPSGCRDAIWNVNAEKEYCETK